MSDSDGGSGILGGLTVVEAGSAIAGPLVGKILADNGANTIKVEPLRGDLYRYDKHWYDTHGREDISYRFLEYNTGKESIAIDLKTEEGAEILWGLLEEADVFIENTSAGAMERLGFGWEELHARNPELVYCSITGYGEEGPYADLPAYDPVIQGVSGWADLLSDDTPELTQLWVLDHVTAMYATIGILMALVERGVNGEGQRVDVAMLDAAVSLFGHPLAEMSAALNDDAVEPHFPRGTDNAPVGMFEAKDGLFALLVDEEAWEPFCRAIGREEYLQEGHRFATLDGRLEHADELDEELRPTFLEKPAEEWVAYLSEEAPGVICAPGNRMEDIPDDPQVQHREIIEERTHPILGEYLLASPPVQFSQASATVSDAPGFGEQTGDILRALKYSDSEIRKLRDEGVVR